MSDRGALLRSQFGAPTSLGHEGHIWAFGHASPEAAAAFAAANREDGHPAWSEKRGEVWASVVDLGPAMQRAAEKYHENDKWTVSITPPDGVEDAAGQIADAIREATRV